MVEQLLRLQARSAEHDGTHYEIVQSAQLPGFFVATREDGSLKREVEAALAAYADLVATYGPDGNIDWPGHDNVQAVRSELLTLATTVRDAGGLHELEQIEWVKPSNGLVFSR
ncbi:MAG: hypothetical protein ABI196_15175 [Bradyrhizobium sp.]